MSNIIGKVFRRATQEVRNEFNYLFSRKRPAKIIFDHLPKCAGSSLCAYLISQYPYRKTFMVDGYHPMESVEKFRKLPKKKRFGYDLVQGHMAHELLDDVSPDALSITVFRDPVDRIVSHYYFVKRNPTHYLYEQVMSENMNLEEYAASGLSDELRNWYTTHFSGLGLEEAEHDPQAAIDKALSIVVGRYDIFGTLEDFPDFTKRLQAEAGFRYPYRNRKVNVTNDRPALDDIPDAVIEKIKKLNHLDVVFYDRIREMLKDPDTDLRQS